jgi:predicted PhzF superfamily epimerase YddE/YHI9
VVRGTRARRGPDLVPDTERPVDRGTSRRSDRARFPGDGREPGEPAGGSDCRVASPANLQADQIADLGNALGVEPDYVGRSVFDLLVVVGSEDVLRGLRPDFPRLRELAARGIAVTSRSDDPRFDFVSRFFAPGVGIDEDPVTGSAHCCLGPYWCERLGKTEMKAFQASLRGGVVNVRVAGERVLLGGHAVTVFRAELTPAATA